jgi:hypothetical protein
MNLVLLLASPNVGVGTVKGSSVNSKVRRIGIRCIGETLEKKIERLLLEVGIRHNVFIRNN